MSKMPFQAVLLTFMITYHIFINIMGYWGLECRIYTQKYKRFQDDKTRFFLHTLVSTALAVL